MTQIQLNLKVEKTHTERAPVNQEIKPEAPDTKPKSQPEHKKNSKSVGAVHLPLQMPSRANTPFSQKSTPRANVQTAQKPGIRNFQPKSKPQTKSLP